MALGEIEKQKIHFYLIFFFLIIVSYIKIPIELDN